MRRRRKKSLVYTVYAKEPGDEANKCKDFCLKEKDDCLKLKRTHQYYYQIQATMYCTKRKWCDFVVRTTVDLHKESLRIVWDPQFWLSVLPVLRTFYFTAILPELALPRIQKGGIREANGWLKDPAAWKQQITAL